MRVVLDTSGEALRLGVKEGRPYMLKCNRYELAELVGQPLKRLEDIKQAAQRAGAGTRYAGGGYAG